MRGWGDNRRRRDDDADGMGEVSRGGRSEAAHSVDPEGWGNARGRGDALGAEAGPRGDAALLASQLGRRRDGLGHAPERGRAPTGG